MKELAIVGGSSKYRPILKAAAKLAGSTVLGEAAWRYTSLQLLKGHSPEEALKGAGRWRGSGLDLVAEESHGDEDE